ncbi:flagellar protein FlaG [Caldanaerobius polysaccharolyticus]|uniref:flagellar protein FlaG n=1 Tax=Caldanaerobius polysaccharolyticus TaxID=44256 RepID=UPI00047DCCC8|nr:flagellar protein FlaG [Caldanaerobius polysaccharolyticus]
MNIVPAVTNVPAIKPVKGQTDRDVHLKKEGDGSQKETGKNIDEIKKDRLVKAVEDANKKIKDLNIRIELSVHEKTKDVVVKFVDSDTNQVIKEYPPEKYLDLVASLWELAGLFVDEKV